MRIIIDFDNPEQEADLMAESASKAAAVVEGVYAIGAVSGLDYSVTVDGMMLNEYEDMMDKLAERIYPVAPKFHLSSTV